jgi:arsenate reductase
MKKTRVLFICTHNSARSQIAEAFLNKLAGDRFEAMSAGLAPTVINPLVIESMKEAGIDLSDKKTKSVFDLYKKGELFSYVIAVCDKESAEKCPTFAGITERIDWSFDDPAAFTGTHGEQLVKMRKLRDEIKRKVQDFVKKIK